VIREGHSPRWAAEPEKYNINTIIIVITSFMKQNPSREANRFSASQEIPAIYATRSFITAFTHVRHLSLPTARLIRFSPCPHPISWRSVLILSSYLQLGLPSGLFLSGLPARHILLGFITKIVFGEQYRSFSSSLCSFLHSSVTSSLLRPNYSPQHPILKQHQTTFLHQH
jgi:hypothetical protein